MISDHQNVLSRRQPSPSHRPPSRRRGFTLIEMLVVIVIIGVLAALLLPAVSAARKYGRRATALTEAKQIETAWKQYYSEYERWPTTIGYTSGAVRISGDVAAILHSGDDVVGDNPKHLQFMQFKRVNADGTPVTPYARIERDDAATPDEHYYWAMFDMNYDNRIEADTTTPDADDPLTNTIQRSVIVWTVNDDVPPDDELYIIGSWK